MSHETGKKKKKRIQIQPTGCGVTVSHQAAGWEGEPRKMIWEPRIQYAEFVFICI